MNDEYSNHIIPSGVDYVIEILFWNYSEIAIASVLIMYGIATNQVFLGIAGFFGVLVLLKKYKSRTVRGLTQHLCWYSSLMQEKGLKRMPPPAVTRFEQ